MLFIGSGVAGLRYVLEVAKHGSVVAVITKAEPHESNTNYAQGGVSAVLCLLESVESRMHDTIVDGTYLCDEETVRVSCKSCHEKDVHSVIVNLPMYLYDLQIWLGEVGCTGLHRANRLASNSLLASTSFCSKSRATIYRPQKQLHPQSHPIVTISLGTDVVSNIIKVTRQIRKELQSIMWELWMGTYNGRN